MMRKLLAEMAGGEPMTLSELARALGVNPPEVQAMLGELAELGYLQDLACREDGVKSGACSGCPSAEGCRAGSPRHLWTLSAKGRRAALRPPTPPSGTGAP